MPDSAGTPVVAYIRVSTAGQEAQGASLPEQSRRIQEWCVDRGMTLLAVFKDAESGESFENRYGFKEAIAYTMEGQQDCAGLVVFNFDRFAREAGWSEVIRKELAMCGKGLFSVEENFDLSNMYGEFTFQVRMATAELMRKQIIQLLQDRRTAKIVRGGWGGHRPPYGFKPEQAELVADPQEQRLVSTALHLRARGWGYQAIADYFNAWLVKNPARYGGPKWSKKAQRPRLRPTKRVYSPLFNRSSIWAIINPEEMRIMTRKAHAKAAQAAKSGKNRNRLFAS